MSDPVPANSASPPGPRRRRRWPWFVLGALGLLVVAAALALPALLDVERYRPHIERALSSATGWEAELGAIEFSAWRGMALTVRPASLGAPGDASRFSAGTIEIRAALRPLLRGRLEIRSVSLIEPDILLVRRTEKEGWVLPVGPAKEASAGGAVSATAATPSARGGASGGDPEGQAGGGFSVTIDGVTVRDGRLRLDDRAGDLDLELSGLDLTLDPATGETSGSGDLAGGGALVWSGTIGKALDLTLRDVPSERLHPFLGDALIHGGATLSGKFRVAFPLELSGEATARGLTLLAGERPFDAVTVALRVTTAGEAWTLDRLEVDADGVKLTGRGPLTPALALDLELPPTPLDDTLRAAESVLPLPLDARSPGEVDAKLSVRQPAGGALHYTASGHLSAAEFRTSEILPPATDVRAEFRLDRKGALEIRVLDANVGGGPATGVARLDSIDPPGTLTFDGGLRDAVFGALLEGILGDSARRLTGPTGLDAALALDLGRESIDARALGGRLDLGSREVSLPGWDLEGAIRRRIDEKAAELNLQSLVESKLGQRGKQAAGQGAAAIEQVFDDLAVSIDFDRWPWRLERLELRAGELTASGKGTFDPVAGTVDLRVTARLDAGRTAELVRETGELKLLVDREGRLTLPLELKGAMLSPSIGVDLGKAFSNSLDQDDTREKVKGLLKGLLDRD